MIEQAKRIIKYLLYLGGYIFYHNRKSKVLYYHDLTLDYTDMGTSIEDFLSHLKTIKQCGFEIVDTISKKTNQVMIAFDDGWKGLYDNQDVLIKNGIAPTVFIAVELIGKEGYMNKEQILDLISKGFHFECHTWTHTGLPEHKGEDLIHELLDAKNQLENIFNIQITQICFPQGRYSADVINACKSSGFKVMYSSVLGSYFDEYDKCIVRRCFMYGIPNATTRFILEGDVPFIRKKDYKNLYVK